MSGKRMFISDCKTLHMKFDGMDANEWILTDEDAAHFLFSMTLASFESYMDMKKSQIRSERKIAILAHAYWCLLNDVFMAAVVMQSLSHKSSNDAAYYHMQIWCY